MKVSKHFLNSIPIDNRAIILEKVKMFESDLLLSKGYSTLPKGYYVRRIEGTDIYKFRVNNGDRILYRYESNKSDIVLLEYCKHDFQVRRAKSINNVVISHEVYDYKCNLEEIIDDNISEDILRRYKNEYSKIVEDYCLDEETITVGVESNILEDKKYLTIEQFECIKDMDIPKIIIGCAGSGKTLIALKLLDINSQLNIHSAYITLTDRLKESAKEIYTSIYSKNDKISFKTLNEIALQITGIKEIEILSYSIFHDWIKNNDLKEITKNISTETLWYEMNSILRNTNSSTELISIKEYLEDKFSKVDKKFKKDVYALILSLVKWQSRMDIYDETYLYKKAKSLISKPLYDYIVFDEFQELNNTELIFLNSLCDSKKNYILLGDIHQRLVNFRDDFFYVTNLINKDFRLYLLDKNYRSSDGVIKWINKLKSFEFFFKDNEYKLNVERAMRNGNIPKFVNNTISTQDLLKKVSMDVDSIIIVGDNLIKENFKNLGMDTSRVFTVLECRGLEYNNIFCIGMWDYISNTKLYNAIYIAATRAKRELVFIENNNNEFNELFQGYFEKVSDLKEVLNIETELDNRKWIEEGQKLEKAKKYRQAADAYKKGGDFKKEENCIRIEEKNLMILKIREKGIFVDINCEKITTDNLSKIIDKLKENNITLESWIQLITYHIDGEVPLNSFIYIGYNKRTDIISRIIFNSVNTNIMTDKHVSLKIVNKNIIEDDIEIRIYKEKIYLEFKQIEELRFREKIRINNENELYKYGIGTINIPTEIIDRNRDMKTEDILKDIFDN